MTDLVSVDQFVKNGPAKPIDFTNLEIDLDELNNIMSEAHKKFGGYGITSTMIGIPWSSIVIGEHSEVIFNPKIVWESDELVALEEANRLWPGLIVKIKRPNQIRLRWQDKTGQVHADTYSGLTARIILHYMDALNGNVFWKRANRYHIEKARKRLTNKVNPIKV